MTDVPSTASFGYWVRRRRQALDLTQAELADRVGCATVTISKIEQDVRRPSLEIAELLAQQLGIPEDQQPLFVKAARAERSIARLPLTVEPLPSPDLPRNNLPAPLDPFVGREDEVAELNHLLAHGTTRLVTILGPGGIGKTRLALAVGEEQSAHSTVAHGGPSRAAQPEHTPLFPDGVFFVALAPLQLTEQVAATIAESIGYQLEIGEQTRTPERQLLDYLKRKSLLLILDNFEHLSRAGDLVLGILNTASNVQILVTSRERLHLRGEQVYPLQGLTFPHGNGQEELLRYSAAQLFLQYLRLGQPDFTLEAEDRVHLARICQLVGGMPLALSLAAGWAALLPLAEIAEEIQKNIDFLATELGDLPDRQRSMRAAFEYSWQRLHPNEQQILARLSVFHGGFDRQAAIDVAEASLHDLAALVAKSLVHVRPGRNRYEIHELLRQFAAEKLALQSRAVDVLRDRHGAYYTAWLEERAEELKGARQREALAALETDLENARVGWLWCVQQTALAPVEQGLDGLLLCYEWQGRYEEGRNVCVQALTTLARAHADGFVAQAKLQTWLCRFRRALGEVDDIGQLLQASMALLDRAELDGHDVRYARAAALEQQANLVAGTDIEAALLLFDQSLDRYRALNARWEMAGLMIDAGAHAVDHGLTERGDAWYRESRALFEALGDPRGLTMALVQMAVAANRRWDLDESVALLTQSIEILSNLGNRALLVNSQYVMGYALTFLGRFDGALAYMEASLTNATEQGSATRVFEATTSTAHALINLGDFEQAVIYGRDALSMAEAMQDSGLIGWSSYTLCQALLGNGSVEDAEQTARTGVAVCRSAGNRLNLACNLTLLARAVCDRGEIDAAGVYLVEALQITADLRYHDLFTLSGTAFFLARIGRTSDAIELYALLRTYPYVSKSAFFETVIGQHIDVLNTVPHAASQESVATTEEKRGRKQDLGETVVIWHNELASISRDLGAET